MIESAPVVKKSKLTSVCVHTWGTDQYGGNGMAHFMDAQLFGGSIGHACVEVTFPADQQGSELVKKYCYKDGIPMLPVEMKEQNVLDENNNVIKEKVYSIYFTWWPGGTTIGNNLLNQDNIAERIGQEVP